MTDAEAQALCLVLAAAFPHPAVPEMTLRLYRARLAELEDAAAARHAVDVAVENGSRFPAWSVLRTDYREEVRRRRDAQARLRGLPEPDSQEPDSRSGQERAREALGALTRAAETGPMHRIVRERLAALAGGETLDQLTTQREGEESLPLEPGGRCDDCADEERLRFRHGRLVLCRACFDDRRRVGARIGGA
jgi:hypothetical protein